MVSGLLGDPEGSPLPEPQLQGGDKAGSGRVKHLAVLKVWGSRRRYSKEGYETLADLLPVS